MISANQRRQGKKGRKGICQAVPSAEIPNHEFLECKLKMSKMLQYYAERLTIYRTSLYFIYNPFSYYVLHKNSDEKEI